MNFKRYVEASDTWVDSHYIKGTDTDTITTLPAIIYPLAQTATIGLKGNTTQSGTPTSANPVMPQGTGDKTANLWNEDYTGISGTITYKPLYVGEGAFTMSSDVEISAGSAGTLFLLAGNVSSGASTATNGVYKNHDVTTTAVDGYVTVAYRYYTVDTPVGKHSMLNSGSTALPYEPYGQYKIPISSVSTTTPVYLGEVESTRRIKKYEFTGQETGWNYSTSGGRTRAYIALSDSLGASLCICSHYDYVASSIFYPDIDKFTLNATGSILIGLDSTIYTDVTAFKSYLATQYAAGTPVCVWYVLATEETGIVNEPLMKIGTYADSISGISIPTTAGANTLDVQTSLKPSEVTASFNGWHPVSSAHERSGGTWT